MPPALSALTAARDTPSCEKDCMMDITPEAARTAALRFGRG